jgi:hypothetical protein
MFAHIRGAVEVRAGARIFQAVLKPKYVYLIQARALDLCFHAPGIAGKFAHGAGNKISLPPRAASEVDIIGKLAGEITGHGKKLTVKGGGVNGAVAALPGEALRG